MKWVGHVARMENMRVAYSILGWKPQGKEHLEDLGVEGR
jgi:hypothetical protein